MKKIIGFAGVPPEEMLRRYGRDELFDLDVIQKYTDYALAERYLPKIFCAILKTVFANALYLKPDVIISDVGEGKCDGMRFVSRILKDVLKKTRIIETRNYNDRKRRIYLAVSSLPLREKVELIMKGAVEKPILKPAPCKPSFGFWGVPPNDFSLLELFSDDTHVFGWTRCAEADVPADAELELLVQEKLPTVFFAQSFCYKNSLAKFLAKRHNGLYVEVDKFLDRSAKLKVEAFLEFNKK